MTEKLDKLYDLKCGLDALALEKRQLMEKLMPPELLQALDDIEAEFGDKAEGLKAQIASLEDEIKADVLAKGETVRGKYMMAIWNKGRVTWDGKKLDGMMALIPALADARTETLRAHREATRASYQANSDIVQGWVWHAKLDTRTCAACWVMHGTEHRIDEILDDHPNGRCAMAPKTATWLEIGERFGIDLSGIPDTNPEIEPGVLLFERLPEEQQITILGPAKYAAWKDGLFSLSDIVGRKHSMEWGTHRHERSLQDLIGEKGKEFTRLALMGVAQRAGNYTVDDLIRVAGIGLRELSSQEIDRIRKYVSRVGFNPHAKSRVSQRMVGMLWQGRTIHAGQELPSDEWHFIKHVLIQREWPGNTLFEEYLESLRSVIASDVNGIMISRYQGRYWQLAFVGKSGLYKGVGGNNHILIEYRVGYGYWITGFQPVDLARQLEEYRDEIRWIQKID